MACTLQKIFDIQAAKRVLSRKLKIDSDEEFAELLLNSSVSFLQSGLFVAIAHEASLFVLKQRDLVNNEDGQPDYDIILDYEMEDDDQITQLITTQLVFQTKSTSGFPDITCFIMGFTSGFVRVFSDKCDSLFEQQFHLAPVKKIKVNSFYSRHLAGKTSEESDTKLENQISILYDDCLVTLPFDMFAATIRLRLIRNIQRNRLQVYEEHHIQFQKWTFPPNVRNVADFAFIREYKIYGFDHLLQMTNERQTIQTLPSGYNNNCILLAGNDPFICFVQVIVKSRLPTFNDLAETAFGAVKNFIPFFEKEDKKPKLEFVHQLKDKYCFYDGQREAISTVISPDGSLALISDNLGRVTLFDVKSNLIMRMWKGYRNCECAFVEVPEETKWDSKCKKTLFVCLLIPKRQILEIWPARYGSRVTAFNVGARCRLIYIDHHLLGTNFVLLKNLLKVNSSNTHLLSCCAFLLDCDQYALYSIDIPFICSIESQENSKLKDNLILKQLPVIFERKEFLADKVISLFEKIQTNPSKIVFLDMLIKQNKTEVLGQCVASLVEDLQRAEPLSEESMRLMQKCTRIQRMLNIYAEAVKFNAGSERIRLAKNIVDEPPQDVDIESEKLKWKSIDFTRIISLFSYGESLNPAVQTIHILNMDFNSFTNQFSANHQAIIRDENDQFDAQKVSLRINTNSLLKPNLGNFLFAKQLAKGNEPHLIQTYLNNGVDPFDLLKIVFTVWLSDYFAVNWKTWQYMYQITENIFEFIAQNSPDYTKEIRTYFKQITNTILNSDHLSSAIVAACILDSAVQRYTNQDNEQGGDGSEDKLNPEDKTDEKTEDTSEEEWESLSIEKETFNWSLKQLKDTYLLNLLLHYKQSEPSPDVTLSYLKQSHPGIVCELVAKWCVEHEMCPEFANDQEEEAPEEMHKKTRSRFLLCLGDDSLPLSYNGQESEQINQLLYHLRMRFPCNLDPDALYANCAFYSVLKFMSNYTGTNSVYLQQCVNYLNRINNGYLKHTLACLMWDKLLVNKFKTFFNKIEQGEHIDPSNDGNDLMYMMTNAIHFSCELLELILGTINSPDSMPQYLTDEWWKDELFIEKVKTPIIQLALALPKAKLNIVIEHCHLFFVTDLAFNFSLMHKKGFKPSCLFPSFVYQVLFRDLHYDLGAYGEDEQVTNARMQFAVNSIQAIAKTVPVVVVDIPNEMEKKSYAQAMNWVSRLLTVCREWDLNIDTIRRRFIRYLYQMNSCVFAEELCYTVSDRDLLAKELINEAAFRVMNIIKDSFYTEINKMPSRTAFWLKELYDARRSKLITISKNDYANYLRTTSKMLDIVLSFLESKNDAMLIDPLLICVNNIEGKLAH